MMKHHNTDFYDTETVIVAAVQMSSGSDVAQNLSVAAHLVDSAARRGAQLVVLPENFAAMGMSDDQKCNMAEEMGNGPLQRFLSYKAREHRIWLIGGSIPTCAPLPGRLFNTCFVYDPNGECAGYYNKIHLFRFRDQNAAYDETRIFESGNRVVEIETPFARIGLSICYDIRFPEMYRLMRTPDLIVLPAAFTQTTGRAHWKTLLRARAIENQCYILASAQAGVQPNGRRTFGHSMLIDPWGEVVASLAMEENGVLTGALSRVRIQSVRQMLPALDNRLFIHSQLTEYHASNPENDG